MSTFTNHIPSSDYIKGLDALRAFSILLVLFNHLGSYHWLPDTPFFKLHLWNLISGTTGVRIFFVLSGFLITRILTTEFKKSGTIRLRRFFRNRLIRLAPPLILFYLTIALLMLLNVIPSAGTAWILSLVACYNFASVNYTTAELAHTWSLAVEWQFYSIWPFLMQKITVQTLKLIAIAILFMLCIFAHYFFDSQPHLFQNSYTERWLFPAIAPLLAGSFFFLISTLIPALPKYLFILLFSALYAAPLYCHDFLLPHSFNPSGLLIV